MFACEHACGYVCELRIMNILDDVENLSFASVRRSNVLFSVVLDSDGSRAAGWYIVGGCKSVGC